MRPCVRFAFLAVGVACFSLGCASGGAGDDPSSGSGPVADSGGGGGLQDVAHETMPSPADDSGSMRQGQDSDVIDPTHDSSTAVDSSEPPADTSVPTADVAPPPPPGDSGTGSDDCDTSNPIYAVEAAAEAASGDEELCVLGCTASQCCYEVLCVAK